MTCFGSDQSHPIPPVEKSIPPVENHHFEILAPEILTLTSVLLPYLVLPRS